MSVPLLFIIGLVTIQVLIIIIYVTHYRPLIPSMTGMDLPYK
ncbi:hypothetical protein [Lentibacillus cibarius]|nr:hypothetical protein [Lentibacillus cibarius]